MRGRELNLRLQLSQLLQPSKLLHLSRLLYLNLLLPKKVSQKHQKKLHLNQQSLSLLKNQLNPTGFILQVGVYSDAANVAQLQAKLKQAGFTSSTETISTANGDKIQLKSGEVTPRVKRQNAAPR